MKKIWVAIIIVVVAGGFFLLRKRKGDSSRQPEYQTVKVERGNIEMKVLCTGTIQPYTRVEVKSPISGRIDKVRVNEGNRVRVGDILVWISSEDRVALLDAAKSGLEQAQKSKDKAALKEAKLVSEIADKSYKPISITTSISGEVIKRDCEPGQNISPQDILFVISDKLVASVEVDEVDIGKIRLGQGAKIILDAFPDKQIMGKTTKISRESRIVSNVTVYDVMVNPINVPSYWASGMTANVEFFVESKEDVLIIPRSAVKKQKGMNFVMVLEDRPEPQEVEIGISDGRMVEVVYGLEQGEEIILRSEEAAPSRTKGPRKGMMFMMRRKK